MSNSQFSTKSPAYGNSSATRPPGFKSVRRPATKSLVSGACAKTLLPENEIGRLALGHESLRALLAEEFHAGVDALFAGDHGDVGGGFDAQTGDAALDEVFQQVAVVASDFHDEAVRAQPEFRRVLIGRRARMTQHGVRERREIEVFGEQRDRGHEVHDLEQPAAVADREAQREAGFGFVEVLGAQEVVGQRLEAEVEDEVAVDAPASAAGKVEGRGSVAHGA